MPTRETERKPGTAGEVMDLAEAAAFLRVPEADLAALVEAGGVPARKIGPAWRLTKSALVAWLSGAGNECPGQAKPGSKEAVLQVFGINKDDSDFEEQMALMRKYREEGGWYSSTRTS